MSDPNNINLLKGAAGSGVKAKYASDVFIQGGFLGGVSTRGIDLSANSNNHSSRGRFTNPLTDGCMILVKNVSGPDAHGMYIYDTMRRTGNNCYPLDVHGTQDTSFSNVTIQDNNIYFYEASSDPAGLNKDDSITQYACFKQADKFFKMGTYTGNGNSGDRVFNHGLGCRPGMLWIKKYGGSGGNRDFLCWHASIGETGYFRLDDDGDSTTYFKIQIATENSTSFTINGANDDVNESGGTYAWYAFGDGSDTSYGPNEDKAIIKYGSFNPTAAGVNISTGFEPAWGLFKRKAGYSSAPNPSPFKGRPYFLSEVTSGFGCGDQWDGVVYPHGHRLQGDSTTGSMVRRHYDGFEVGSYGLSYSQTDKTTIYFCISRDEAPAPSGITVSKVFKTSTYSTGTTGRFDTGFQHGFELGIFEYTQNGTHSQDSRMCIFRRGAFSANRWKYNALPTEDMEGFNNDSNINSGGFGGYPFSTDQCVISKYQDYYRYGNRNPSTNNAARATFFSRLAPIMTTLTYIGDGTGNRTIPHNLTVVPDIVWFKSPNDSTSSWFSSGKGTYSTSMQSNWWKYPCWTAAVHNSEDPTGSGTTNDLSAIPDDTNIYVGSSLNQNNTSYYVVLWASYPGILKIGGYSGNGTNTDDSQNIDCGFGSYNKPAWLLIRRFTNPQDYDHGNNWYFFSSAIGYNDAGSSQDRWMVPEGARGTETFYNNTYPQNIINTHTGGFQVIQDNDPAVGPGSYSKRADLNKNGEHYHYIAYSQ